VGVETSDISTKPGGPPFSQRNRQQRPCRVHLAVLSLDPSLDPQFTVDVLGRTSERDKPLARDRGVVAGSLPCSSDLFGDAAQCPPGPTVAE